MFAVGNDIGGSNTRAKQARMVAARLLFDVLIERQLTATERRETLLLLTEILAQPLSTDVGESGTRHPSVSRAMAQLGQLEAQLHAGSAVQQPDPEVCTWDCAFVGTLEFSGPRPTAVGAATLADIAGSSAEVRRAIELHQPFANAIWNGLRLGGRPSFNAADGRFIGYHGSVELSRNVASLPSSPTADDDARLAHEIRSPLNAIIGFADMIAQQTLGPAPVAMRAGAQRILVMAAELLAALDDMTDAARLDLGRYPVELGWIDARPVIDRAIGRFVPLAQERQAVLRGCSSKALWMQVDEQALERLVERLLAGIIGLAEPLEIFELEAVPIKGDCVAITLSRPARLAGWTSDELRNPGIEIDIADGDRHAAPVTGLGFALRLVGQLADRLGGAFVVEPHRFVVNLPALSTVGVVSRIRAT